MKGKFNANTQAVLNAMQSSRDHPTASEIYDKVRQVRPSIGLASIYRILHQLVTSGYINELHYDNQSSRYDAHIARHDHAICQECGALIDIPFDIRLPYKKIEEVEKATGIHVVSHELLLYGTCSTCQGQHTEESHKEHPTEEELEEETL